MIKYLLGILFSAASFTAFPQARLILQNGGIVNITNGAFVVIDNPAPNAITRNTSGHIISEGEFNRVKWNIGTTAGNYVIPFGIGAVEYLPVTFSTSGAVGAGGNLTFAMYPVGSWLNTANLPTGINNFVNNYGLNNSAYSIDRFWRIEPSNYITQPAFSNLLFTYRDIEHSVASNFIQESNLIAQRYNMPLDSWDDFMPATVVNTGANTATVATLPSEELYTWWTLVDNHFVLPIELTSFTVECRGKEVNIQWETASESNNAYFEIQRSTDAIQFETILQVASKNGNSSAPQVYTATDMQPVAGKSYYRLKQVDKEGNFSYSSAVVSSCAVTLAAAPAVHVYPNPATDVLTVDIKGLPGMKSLMIYDVIGQEMMARKNTSSDENAQEVIDISGFAKATYIIRLDVNGDFYQTMKFVKR